MILSELPPPVTGLLQAQSDRPVKIRLRTLVVPQLPMRPAPFVVSNGLFYTEPDCFIQVTHALMITVQPYVRPSSAQIQVGLSPPQSEGLVNLP